MSSSTDTFLLGIPKNADAEAIKKAYRRAALKYHPDKSQNTNAVAIFQAIQKAHEVLADPKKRQIYDKYGSRGIDMLSSVSGYAPFIDPDMILKVNWFLGLATLIVALLIVFPSFVVSKIDGGLDWPWMAVFSPLFVVDAFILYQIFAIDTSDSDQHSDVTPAEKTQQRMFAAMVKTVMSVFMILVSVCQVFVAAKLDGYVDWSWVKVASPWLALEGLNFCTTLVTTVMGLQGRVLDPTRNSDEPRKLSFKEGIALVYQNAMPMVIRASQIILILVKVDGNDISWPIVFTPTWIWGGIRILSLVVAYYRLKRDAADPQSNERRALWTASLILFILGGGLVFTSVGLFLRRVDFVDGYPSAAVILIPVFIILAISFLCVCCIAPCAVAVSMAGLEEELNKKQDPEAVSPNRRIEPSA